VLVLIHRIRQKYESKKFAAPGPIPDPDSIDIGNYLRSNDAPPRTSSAQPATKSAAHSAKPTTKEANLLDPFDDDHFGDFVSANSGSGAFDEFVSAAPKLTTATQNAKTTQSDPFGFDLLSGPPSTAIQPSSPAARPGPTGSASVNGLKSKDAIMALFNSSSPSPGMRK